jgi:Carboxypeptidase regulatory-like domain
MWTSLVGWLWLVRFSLMIDPKCVFDLILHPKIRLGSNRRERAMYMSMKKLLMVTGLVVGVGVTVCAQEPTSALSFLVLKDYNGKPVRNAAVVLHPVNSHGKQGRGGFELKTDSEGKTNFDGVPYGKLRVQVLAPGFQTFGEDYDVGTPTMEIRVKLQRPQKQYSIYEDHPNDPKKDNPTDKRDDKDGGAQKPQ